MSNVSLFILFDTADNVCVLIELVLQNNYFKFNDISYCQKMGTAMGSSMAPAYASIFMCKFEMDFMKSKKISNDQELIQSDPISCPQNQKGNN